MKNSFIALLLGSLLTLSVASPAVASVPTIDLGSAESFSVLAGTGVSNTLSTTLSGDLGLSPSGAISGFSAGVVNGHIHDKDAAAAQAQTDRLSAYNAVAARTATNTFAGDNIGITFTPGVHTTGAAFWLTGTMTLDGGGDPNAVFIFQVTGALNTAANSAVVLVNQANADNVFWQVTGAVSTGADSSFSGTILTAGALTLGERSSLNGRALSAGLVMLTNNTVVTPVLADPVVVTSAASAVQTTTATISGTVDPNTQSGLHVRFIYSTSSNLGSPTEVDLTDTTSADSPYGVTTNLLGLSPGTLLFYTLQVENPEGGWLSGATRSFTTASPTSAPGSTGSPTPAPGSTGSPPTSLTPTRATAPTTTTDFATTTDPAASQTSDLTPAWTPTPTPGSTLGFTSIGMRVPGAPTEVSRIIGDSFAVVRWTAPVNHGSSPVTSYTVTSSPGGFTRTTPAGVSEAAVFGLSNGVPYSFSVVAHNEKGASVSSGQTSFLIPPPSSSSTNAFSMLFTNVIVAWWLIPVALLLAVAFLALVAVLAKKLGREKAARSDMRSFPHSSSTLRPGRGTATRRGHHPSHSNPLHEASGAPLPGGAVRVAE